MASQNTGRKPRNALTDCINTPITRPRRSCSSYRSSSATKKTTPTFPQPQTPSNDEGNLQPRNPSNDAENAFASVEVYRNQQNVDPSRANNSDFLVKDCGTPSATLRAGDGFWVLEDSEDASQNIRVYSARRQNTGRNSVKTPSSCASFERKYNTTRSSEPENTLRDVEGSCKSTGCSRKRNEVSSEHETFNQRFGTPQPVLPAVDRFEFPDGNEDVDSQTSRFHFKWREEDISEKSSLSCPPLRRAIYESPAGGRSAKVQKRHSLRASEVLPKSGRSKEKVRRRDSSTSANDGKCSLPEDFVRQQQAHFAEIDAFVLQEEDMSDA